MDPIILPVKETVEFRSWHVPAASRSGSEHSVTVPVRARQMPRLARSAEGSIQARATLCRAGSKDPGIKPLVPTHCNAATFTLPRCESSCRAGRCAGGRAAGFARSRSPARRLLPPRATPQSTHPLHASDWIDAAIRRAGVGRICRAAARVHRRVWDGRTDNEEGKKEFGGRVVALRSYCIFGSFFRNLGLRIRCRFASVLRRATLHASPQLAYVSRGNVPAGWRLSWWCVPTSARQRRPERPGRCAVRLCLPAPRLSYFVTDGDGKWLAISAAFAYPFRLATSVESNSPYLGASPQPWNVLVNFHGAGRRAFPKKPAWGPAGRSPYTRQTPRPVTPSCRAT